MERREHADQKAERQKRHDYGRYIFDLMIKGEIHQDETEILYKDEEKYKKFLENNLPQ